MARGGVIGLRIVLALSGAWIALTGINVAFGGISTLGWQGERYFFEVTNLRAFLAQDSHVRFLGGLWLGIGILFMVGSARLRECRGALQTAFALVFVGGVVRLGQGRLDVTLGPEVLGSWIGEMVGMPLLSLWLRKASPLLETPPSRPSGADPSPR